MFHYVKFIFLLFFAFTPLIFFEAAKAENTSPAATPPPAPPLPVVEQIVGRPVTITWADGRQAQLEVTSTIAERVALPMAISENACEPTKRVICEYRSGLSVATYRLAWTKHPDPAHIGQTVRTGISNEMARRDLVAAATWTLVDNMLFPDRYEAALADEISCPSWEWLAQGSKLPTLVTIPSISTEFMLTNPNTQQVENKTIMTVTDVAWQKTIGGDLRVQSLGSYDSYIPLGVNAIFIGDVMKWNIEKSQNQYCDIGFKVDIGLLRISYQGLLDRSLKGVFTPSVFDGKTRYPETELSAVLSLRPDMFGPPMVYE